MDTCKGNTMMVVEEVEEVGQTELTASSSHSEGQLSKTNCAISPALSLGLNKYSFVFPLTRINRKFI